MEVPSMEELEHVCVKSASILMPHMPHADTPWLIGGSPQALLRPALQRFFRAYREIL